MTVSELNPELIFVLDSQDVKSVKEYVGESAREYDSFFVGQREGEYTEVWGMFGILPYLNRIVYPVL